MKNQCGNMHKTEPNFLLLLQLVYNKFSSSFQKFVL